MISKTQVSALLLSLNLRKLGAKFLLDYLSALLFVSYYCLILLNPLFNV